MEEGKGPVNGVKEREQRLKRMQIELGRARLVTRPWELFQRPVNIIPARHRDLDPGLSPSDLRGDSDPSLPAEEEEEDLQGDADFSADLEVDVLCQAGHRNGVHGDTLARISDASPEDGDVMTDDANSSPDDLTGSVFLSHVTLFPTHSLAPDGFDSIPQTPSPPQLSPIREESISYPSTSEDGDVLWKDSGYGVTSLDGLSCLTSSVSMTSGYSEESGVMWPELRHDVEVEGRSLHTYPSVHSLSLDTASLSALTQDGGTEDGELDVTEVSHDLSGSAESKLRDTAPTHLTLKRKYHLPSEDPDSHSPPGKKERQWTNESAVNEGDPGHEELSIVKEAEGESTALLEGVATRPSSDVRACKDCDSERDTAEASPKDVEASASTGLCFVGKLTDAGETDVGDDTGQGITADTEVFGDQPCSHGQPYEQTSASAIAGYVTRTVSTVQSVKRNLTKDWSENQTIPDQVDSSQSLCNTHPSLESSGHFTTNRDTALTVSLAPKVERFAPHREGSSESGHTDNDAGHDSSQGSTLPVMSSCTSSQKRPESSLSSPVSELCSTGNDTETAELADYLLYDDRDLISSALCKTSSLDADTEPEQPDDVTEPYSAKEDSAELSDPYGLNANAPSSPPLPLQSTMSVLNTVSTSELLSGSSDARNVCCGDPSKHPRDGRFFNARFHRLEENTDADRHVGTTSRLSSISEDSAQSDSSDDLPVPHEADECHRVRKVSPAAEHVTIVESVRIKCTTDGARENSATSDADSDGAETTTHSVSDNGEDVMKTLATEGQEISPRDVGSNNVIMNSMKNEEDDDNNHHYQRGTEMSSGLTSDDVDIFPPEEVCLAALQELDTVLQGSGEDSTDPETSTTFIDTSIAVTKPDTIVSGITVTEPDPAVTDVTVTEPDSAVTDVTVTESDPAVTDVTATEPDPAVTDVTATEPDPAVTDVTATEPDMVVSDVDVIITNTDVTETNTITVTNPESRVSDTVSTVAEAVTTFNAKAIAADTDPAADASGMLTSVGASIIPVSPVPSTCTTQHPQATTTTITTPSTTPASPSSTPAPPAAPPPRRAGSGKKVLPTSRRQHGKANKISHLLDKWIAIETTASAPPPPPLTSPTSPPPRPLQRPPGSHFHSFKRQLSQSTPNLDVAGGCGFSPSVVAVETSSGDTAPQVRKKSVAEMILSLDSNPVIYGSTGDLDSLEPRSIKDLKAARPKLPEAARRESSKVPDPSQSNDYKMASLQNLNIVLITSENSGSEDDRTELSPKTPPSLSSPPPVGDTLKGFSSVQSLISKFSQGDVNSGWTSTSPRLVSTKQRWSSTPRLQESPLSPLSPPPPSSSPSSSRASGSDKVASPTSSVVHRWTSVSSLASPPRERGGSVSSQPPPQEEEIQQDGRTVYKTKEEKSFSEKPRPWPGENASTAPKVSIKTVSLTPEKPRQWPGESAAPAPKVSIKTITLSSSPKGDGQPAQLTNNFTVGGLQRDGFGPGPGQPYRQQDYQYQQTITTKTVERSGGLQQQPQIRQIQQQSVYQQQKQPVYGQQRQQQQQPGYGQQPQPQQQQATYTQQQQQTTYTQQQQQTSYGQQQQQPGYGQQKQPGYGQQSFVQMQQAGFGQQKQPSYGQQQQQKQQQQQRPQPQQQQQQQQQPSYAQQKQQPSFVQMQQASFGQQNQPSYGQQQPQQQPQQQQQQQPSYGQQKQPSHGQQQQPSFVQMQQASFGQKQQQQPSYTQKQQPARVQQPQQPQQQPSRAQPKELGYTPQIQSSFSQQQQTIPGQQQQPRYGQQPQQPTYGQQKPAQPQPQPQPQSQQQQQQQQQQRSSYQQQQVTYQQQQQRSGQPQQQQSAQQSVSTVRSEVYRQGQPSVATVTTVTSTSSTKRAPAPDEPFPWDEPEEGVHENEPEVRTDLVRESDRNWQAELPSVGQARNLKQKFLTGNLEHRPAGYKKELTPPGMASGGVFENEPLYNPDVVHYGEETQREALPEHGTARYMAHRFKEMEKPVYPSGATPGQRQITPDRTTRGEYVSEPRGYVEKYEGRPESGVFESEPVFLDDVVKADEYEDDRLPECGLARNIAAHFRQVGSYRPLPAPSMPKEFTPPREDGTMLQGYGVYENTPQYDPTVVHAEDQQRDVLPDRGMARTIVTRFRTWSSGDNTPKSPRTKKEFTPPRDGGGVYENEPTEFIPEYNLRPESGILENQPEVRYDVVRANQPPPHEVELPERGLTRNLVSSWRYKESSSSHVTPTGSGRMKEFTPPRDEPRVLVYRASSVGYDGFGASDGSVHPYDLPGQYQPMEEASVFESEPVYLEHVVREADTDWMEGMPRQDSTRKMVAKFRHIQQQAATDPDFASPAARPPLPAARQEGDDRNSRETSPDKVGRSKSMRVAVQLEKCGACQKTVYAMEKIEIEKNAYHKTCFRCSHCHCILTPKTFAINKNVMFCTNHYKQLFATKGNYDEGFGHDQHKNRWKSDLSREASPLPCTESPASSQQ